MKRYGHDGTQFADRMGFNDRDFFFCSEKFGGATSFGLQWQGCEVNLPFQRALIGGEADIDRQNVGRLRKLR